MLWQFSWPWFLKDTLILQAWPSSGLTLSGPRICDGASSMMGRLNGVAVQIQRELSACCFTHPLLSTLSKPCAAGGWQESVTNQGCTGPGAWGCTPYQMSPKQEASFLEKQLNAAMEGGCSDTVTVTVNSRIHPLGSTRWPVCTGAISAVLHNIYNYEMLQETFEDTHKSTHDQN